MAVTKLTCPECKTVLKPAKPVPAGKTVKCPECGSRFTATEDAPEIPLKKPKKPGDKKAGASKKAAKKKDDDDDDGGGTYGFVGEKDNAVKPDIEYAPDM